MSYPLPKHELSRLLALDRFAVLDTLPEPAYDDIVRLASFIMGTPISLVSLIDTKRQWFKANVGLDASETPRDVAFCAHAIVEPEQVMVVEDATKDQRFAQNPLVLGEPHIRFYAGAPLVTNDGYALGTLCVIDTKPRQLSREQSAALKTLARNVMTLLELGLRGRELENANRMLEQISLTDALTGVGNRYAFSHRLKGEVDRARRYRHPLSLLMLDVDHFKSYNDSFGHPMGDELLKRFGNTLSDTIRTIDSAYRYGGEEFAILLPETDAEGAMTIARRLHDAVNAAEWPNRKITASTGVATMQVDISPEDLVEQADRALYWVKEHGRDGVQHFGMMGRDGGRH